MYINTHTYTYIIYTHTYMHAQKHKQRIYQATTKGGKVNSWKNKQTIAKNRSICHKENTSCLIDFI